MSPDLKRVVAEILAGIEGPDGLENARCNLTTLPETLPFVAAAYHLEPDARRRESIIYCLWQFRDPVALPTLAAALHDREERVWKEALDGVVALGGPAALRVLDEARAAFQDGPGVRLRKEWIDEAIGQMGGPRFS